MGYDATGFWASVTRTGRAGCWVCEHLGLATDLRFQSGTACAGERDRCRRLSGGLPLDAHHVVSKQRIKREYPRGAWRVAGLWAPVPWLTGGREEARRTLETLLEDGRNGIPVRRLHHDMLESGAIRFPESAWPEGVRAFALEMLFGWDERAGYVRIAA